MYVKLLSASVIGVEGRFIEVEVDICSGLPQVSVVGLPDSAVRESVERVRAAIKNGGMTFPMDRITINLAPADMRKEGSAFDLAIAAGILCASGQVDPALLEHTLFIGELALNGTVRGVPGVLPMTELARDAGVKRVIVPEDAVEEAYINEANDHLPTLVIKNERWGQAARLLRDHAELACAYLRNVSGVDYETHMEVVYYPWNMNAREGYCIKVRTDRESPSVASVTPIWETANWNEREIYDLLGVDFPGHPDLRRIMMPDDWVGHPLRKDYVPLDPEV